MLIDRRALVHFDWTLVILALILSTIGVLNLYSSSVHADNPSYTRQLVWLLIGIALMLAVAAIDYRFFYDISYPIYVTSLILLLAVLLSGTFTYGAQRWLKIGPVSFQPSEFAKISLILLFARLFHRPCPGKGYTLRDLVIPFLMLSLPVIFILKQPDLGTAIILLLIFISILFFVKVRWSSLLILFSAGLAVLPIAWSLLKDYQRQRVLTFFNPHLDPLGAGYHIIQSKVAIGSGGILGKGFMQGTQCRLGFLPQQETDFIFSAFGEEWGLVGSLVVMGFYFLLILRGLRVAITSKDRFGAILAFGVVAMIFWHVFINIGMTLGLMPVVGIPLPLMSYGGSFMISTMAGIGLILNVSMRRYLF